MTTLYSIFWVMGLRVYALMGNRDIPGVLLDWTWFLGFLFAWIECPVTFPTRFLLFTASTSFPLSGVDTFSLVSDTSALLPC